MQELKYLTITGPKWFDLGANSALNSETTKIVINSIFMPYIKRSYYHLAFLDGNNGFRFSMPDSYYTVNNFYYIQTGSTQININSGNTAFSGGNMELRTAEGVYYDGNLITSFNISIPTQDKCFLFNNQNASYGDYLVSGGTGEIIIYRGDTITGDFVPCLDDDNVVCIYDKIGDTFIYPQGTGTITAGPLAHVFMPSKKSIKLDATGSSETIVVSAQTGWTISTPSWATITPSTGESGETSVIISAPNYTGETVRSETITFTDDDTYSFDIIVRQKGTAGSSSLYMGDNNTTAIYLGSTSVSSIYLGETQVFSM